MQIIGIAETMELVQQAQQRGHRTGGMENSLFTHGVTCPCC